MTSQIARKIMKAFHETKRQKIWEDSLDVQFLHAQTRKRDIVHLRDLFQFKSDQYDTVSIVMWK